MESNPLLDLTGLPKFSIIRPAHIGSAIDTLLAENRRLIDQLARPAVAATWNDFVSPLDDASERLSRAWGTVGHLHGVLDSQELRDAYNESQPKIVAYYTELGQNQALFAKFKELRESAAFADLSPAQRKVIENELRDFKLSGAELNEADRARYAEIAQELASLGTRFSEHLLDSTNAFQVHIEDDNELAGLPEDIKEAAREVARQSSKDGWILTLRAPCYFPVMQYADNRDLREKLYFAHQTRASELANPALDNGPLISRMLELHREAARLLGFETHAHVSLIPKMAGSPDEVIRFLDDLARKARPFAERDVRELEEFAASELGMAKLEAWDIAYASEKLRVNRYAFSEQEVKQYFPEGKVLDGMFRVVNSIFGIRIGPDHAEVWDQSVRFFKVEDLSGNMLGQFYLDPYARETKRGGAWMDEAVTRRRKGNAIQHPVAYLVCNFPAPIAGKPSLLTHDEVITLFHEFGHGLHHLLTKIDYPGVSGIRGVEWDAVELPSQFMENFCWEWDVVSIMTSHADTGASLPRDLFEKMLAAKNFQSGMQMVRQLEFSLFDMHLHYDFDPAGKKTPGQLLDEIRTNVAVVIPPAFTRFPNSFSHIFAGGYCAGYYSYKWAEVLSADAYSAFEKTDRLNESSEYGVLNPVAGARFRDEILAVGGSRPAMESFVAFRGRPPEATALLRHSGMISAS